MSLNKMAWLDAADLTKIHFMVEVRNNGRSALATTLTDDLPSALSYLGASLEPVVLPDGEKIVTEITKKQREILEALHTCA